MKCKIYFTSAHTTEFETTQFSSFDTFVSQLSDLKPGQFMTIDGTRSIAKDHVEYIEKLDD